MKFTELLKLDSSDAKSVFGLEEYVNLLRIHPSTFTHDKTAGFLDKLDELQYTGQQLMETKGLLIELLNKVREKGNVDDKQRSPEVIEQGLNRFFENFEKNSPITSLPGNFEERRNSYLRIFKGFRCITEVLAKKYNSGELDDQQLYANIELIGDASLACAERWRTTLQNLANLYADDINKHLGTDIKTITDHLKKSIIDLVYELKISFIDSLCSDFMNSTLGSISEGSRIHYENFFKRYMSNGFNFHLPLVKDNDSFLDSSQKELELKCQEFISNHTKEYSFTINSEVIEYCIKEFIKKVKSDATLREQVISWAKSAFLKFKFNGHSFNDISEFCGSEIFNAESFDIQKKAVLAIFMDKNIIEYNLATGFRHVLTYETDDLDNVYFYIDFIKNKQSVNAISEGDFKTLLLGAIRSKESENIFGKLFNTFPNELDKFCLEEFKFSILHILLVERKISLEEKKHLFNIILPRASQELILRNSSYGTAFECCVSMKQLELALQIYQYIQNPAEKLKAALFIKDIKLVKQLYDQLTNPAEKLKAALFIKDEEKIIQCINSYGNPFYQDIDINIRAEAICLALNSQKINFFQTVMKQFSNVKLMDGTEIPCFDIVKWMNNCTEDSSIHKEKMQFIFTELWTNNERLDSYYNTYPLNYMIEKSLSLSSIEKYISKNKLDYLKNGVQGLNYRDSYSKHRIIFGVEVSEMYPLNMAVIVERPDIVNLLISKGASHNQGITFKIVGQTDEIHCSSISSFVNRFLKAKQSQNRKANIEIKDIIKKFNKAIEERREQFRTKKEERKVERERKVEGKAKCKRKHEDSDSERKPKRAKGDHRIDVDGM